MFRIVNETPIEEIDEVETDGTAVKEEFIAVDVLVCGLCHKGFHFVYEFQEHKLRSCKKISAYRHQTTKLEKKNPELLGFLLWKNSIAKNKESWKMYKFWRFLPEHVRYSWIQAAKIINSCEELAKTIPDKIILTKPSSSNGNLDEQPPASMKPSLL